METDPRYLRQVRFVKLGEEGQRKLNQSRVLICGCGALGSVLADSLTRAGVGHLRLVDRDLLEISNLHRQVLYDEDDVRDELPKSIAAQRRLAKVNSSVKLEAHVVDVNFSNIGELVRDVDCILDGTDNFETRFLLNDAAHQFQVPWIYGGCIGAEGQQLTIIPGETPCLSCLMHDVPPPGTTPTCDTAGVVGPIVNVIASLQAMEAIKILSGNRSAISRTLNVCDLWESRFRQIRLDGLRESSRCVTCQEHDYPWLRGEKGSHSTILCGRGAVQLSFPQSVPIPLEQLAERWKGLGEVTQNPFLLRASFGPHRFTIFADGRAIISGTEDIAEAKSLYARYVGF